MESFMLHHWPFLHAVAVGIAAGDVAGGDAEYVVEDFQVIITNYELRITNYDFDPGG